LGKQNFKTDANHTVKYNSLFGAS